MKWTDFRIQALNRKMYIFWSHPKTLRNNGLCKRRKKLIVYLFSLCLCNIAVNFWKMSFFSNKWHHGSCSLYQSWIQEDNLIHPVTTFKAIFHKKDFVTVMSYHTMSLTSSLHNPVQGTNYHSFILLHTWANVLILPRHWYWWQIGLVDTPLFLHTITIMQNAPHMSRCPSVSRHDPWAASWHSDSRRLDTKTFSFIRSKAKLTQEWQKWESSAGHSDS